MGRRETVDDKAVLSEVSKLIHAAKANRRIVINARKSAKRGVDLTAKPQASKAKKGAASDEVAPAGAVLRRGGGSVWISMKCSFDVEHRQAKAAALEEKGVERKVFVVPSTNQRYRRRMARWEAENAAAEAEAEVEADEEAEVEADPDAEAVADDAGEEQEAAPTFTESLVAAFGTGAAKCIVKTKSSVARRVKRKALPAPEGARSADASVRKSTETAERRRTRRRRVKQQKATSVLASQKQASNFATQLIALLRKDVYPQLKKGAAPEAPIAAKHQDPNADASAAKQSGKKSAPQQQQQQQPQQQQGGKNQKGGKGGKKRK